MNQAEFESLTPYIIEHETWGIGTREIRKNKKEIGVCYRHENGGSSLGTHGYSFQEIYNELLPYLIEGGYHS